MATLIFLVYMVFLRSSAKLASSHASSPCMPLLLLQLSVGLYAPYAYIQMDSSKLTLQSVGFLIQREHEAIGAARLLECWLSTWSTLDLIPSYCVSREC